MFWLSADSIDPEATAKPCDAQLALGIFLERQDAYAKAAATNDLDEALLPLDANLA